MILYLRKNYLSELLIEKNSNICKINFFSFFLHCMLIFSSFFRSEVFVGQFPFLALFYVSEIKIRNFLH